jgi:ribosomal protein S2
MAELYRKGAPDTVIARLNKFFTRCNEARFMPGGFTNNQIQQDFTELRDIVADLSSLKRKRQGGLA